MASSILVKETLWYQPPLALVVRRLGVRPEAGLGGREVEARLTQYGRNLLPRGKRLKGWQLLLRQFLNPLIIILLTAAVLTLVVGEYADATVISLAVVVNTAIGFWQEFRSSRIFEKLSTLVQVTARVRRGGEVVQIDMGELVPGDIIILRGDAKVPADARLISARNLLVNEALLTGESKAVAKEVCELSGELVVGDRRNMVHLGTLIERGEGEAVVVSTGRQTEIGQIAALTVGEDTDVTPLQERLKRLGRSLTILVLGFSLIIFATGLYEGKPWADMFTTAVAVAVAAIPEGLPAALSVILAIAASRILKRKGLVKKLVGAETLGSTSVIVTDKTGTLTTGIMKVEAIIAEAGCREEDLSRAMMFSSDVVMTKEGSGQYVVRGEATDRAKVEYFLSHGGDYDAESKGYPVCALLPFNDRTKLIASFRHTPGGGSKLFVSGAPEFLLKLSTVPAARQKEILQIVEERARQGYRLIGVAERDLPLLNTLSCQDDDSLEAMIKELKFLGLAAIRDPIREDVRESIKITREAGVRVIMATGDHHLTAAAIGSELGFKVEAEAVLRGDEVDNLSDQELAKRLPAIQIFSRVSPTHKMRLVKLLKDQGEVVAMTGDGINDAPALKAADIGVALGSGSDVTKETAELVLLNDSFSIITAAIREGRVAFDNMRKVTVFLLSNSFTEILIILGALVFRTAFLPVTAVQILWANLVEDSFPNFALAFEPGEKDIMRRRPISRAEKIIDAQGKVIIIIVGLLADLILMGIFLALYFYSLWDPVHIQTFIFAMLAVNSLIIVFPIKSYRLSIFRTQMWDNKFLLWAVAIGFALMAAAIYWPPLQSLLDTVPLPWPQALFVIGFGVFQLLLIELVKWLFRSYNLSYGGKNNHLPKVQQG